MHIRTQRAPEAREAARCHPDRELPHVLPDQDPPGRPGDLILGSEPSRPTRSCARRSRRTSTSTSRSSQQYWLYISGVVTEGDLGKSYQQDTPTTTLMAQRLPATIQLMILTQFLSLAISIPLALYSAYKANSRGRQAHHDRRVRADLVARPSRWRRSSCSSSPSQLDWFPATGYDRITGPEGLGENLRSVALPVIVLTTGLTAVYTRLLRSDLIATLQEDFVLMARSKGLPTWHILLRHALRPSSFSLLTVFGLNFGALIGGTIIVE